ncbi:hypothetical protein Clacol_010119 [Clathrus columnatus]|uniref:Uncharacterized protein n=1 Tax=Clathrus columnatus TaxID=1419009 RepID=A0AAV5AMG4_9AGAM|nr:hypothetical protein Clacol_010119 [Clathrus columnatus]
MISFTSLIVLATVGFSAVSAAAIPKRDLTADITNISAALDQLDADVTSIDPQNPDTVKQTLTTDFAALVNTLSTGQPQFDDSEIPGFMGLLEDLDKVLSDIQNQVPVIQSIDGLSDIMELAVGETETASGGDQKPQAVEALYGIMGSFETVEGLLSAPPSSSSSSA